MLVSTIVYSQKVYRVSIISDMSYSGNKESIINMLDSANVFFKEYDIQFSVSDYMRSDVIAEDKTLDSNLDNFRNDTKTSDITILVVGEHKGTKVGSAFKGAIGTPYSCLTFNANYPTHNIVMVHELLHIFGLSHVDKRDNIMCGYTTKKNMDIGQKLLLIKYGKSNKNGDFVQRF
jgi:hypothetical protein